MILHVTKAQYRGGYRIWLSFNDESSGEIDLAGKLTGSMFAPLADQRLFAKFRVDPELETIVWDNGADLAPEYLRDLLVPSRAMAKSENAGTGKKRRPKTNTPRKLRARVSPRSS